MASELKLEKILTLEGLQKFIEESESNLGVSEDFGKKIILDFISDVQSDEKSKEYFFGNDEGIESLLAEYTRTKEDKDKAEKSFERSISNVEKLIEEYNESTKHEKTVNGEKNALYGLKVFLPPKKGKKTVEEIVKDIENIKSTIEEKISQNASEIKTFEKSIESEKDPMKIQKLTEEKNELQFQNMDLEKVKDSIENGLEQHDNAISRVGRADEKYNGSLNKIASVRRRFLDLNKSIDEEIKACQDKIKECVQHRETMKTQYSGNVEADKLVIDSIEMNGVMIDELENHIDFLNEQKDKLNEMILKDGMIESFVPFLENMSKQIRQQGQGQQGQGQQGQGQQGQGQQGQGQQGQGQQRQGQQGQGQQGQGQQGQGQQGQGQQGQGQQGQGQQGQGQQGQGQQGQGQQGQGQQGQGQQGQGQQGQGQQGQGQQGQGQQGQGQQGQGQQGQGQQGQGQQGQGQQGQNQQGQNQMDVERAKNIKQIIQKKLKMLGNEIRKADVKRAERIEAAKKEKEVEKRAENIFDYKFHGEKDLLYMLEIEYYSRLKNILEIYIGTQKYPARTPSEDIYDLENIESIMENRDNKLKDKENELKSKIEKELKSRGTYDIGKEDTWSTIENPIMKRGEEEKDEPSEEDRKKMLPIKKKEDPIWKRIGKKIPGIRRLFKEKDVSQEEEQQEDEQQKEDKGKIEIDKKCKQWEDKYNQLLGEGPDTEDFYKNLRNRIAQFQEDYENCENADKKRCNDIYKKWNSVAVCRSRMFRYRDELKDMYEGRKTFNKEEYEEKITLLGNLLNNTTGIKYCSKAVGTQLQNDLVRFAKFKAEQQTDREENERGSSNDERDAGETVKE